MLGRVTSTPSGTRGSCCLAIGTPLDCYSARAAKVCSQRYNTRSRHRAGLRYTGGSAGDGPGGLGLAGGPRLAGQRHAGAGVIVTRGVDDDARLGHGGDVEFADGQAEPARQGMQVSEDALLVVGDLV